MWSPLKESHFDPHDSSMSAAVQELYTGLPVTLSAEHSALSDPTVILDAEPETPAFVLACSSDLSSEHQRTYGSKICPQDSHERSDYVGKMSGPRLMELLSKEPAGTEVLAGTEEAQDGSSAEQNGLPGQLREDAGAAKSTRGVAEEGLECFALASKAACWSNKKDPWLIQEGREFLPRPSYAERAGSLQSLEENQANVQVTTENLPNLIKEAPGRKADRTMLFGKAGESNLRVSTGIPPGIRECSDIETVMAKVEVSETSTLVPLEPVSVLDNALAKEHLQGEEERRGPKACATSSATSVLSVSEAEGEKQLNQDKEASAALGNVLPSHQDKTNLYDDSRFASELESRVTIDTLLSDAIPETSNCLFKGSLEFEHILWEEHTDVFEVVCEMLEECPLGENRCFSDTASCENTELLEEWASQMDTGERLLPAYNGEELSSDGDVEQEIGGSTDHSYSCICEGGVEVEKGNAMQSCQKETQASSHSENDQQELQICQFPKEKNMHPKSNASFVLAVDHSSPERHADYDLKSVPSGADSVQRDKHQRYPLPKDGNVANVQEGNASLWKEASNFVCFQSGCNTSTLSLPTCHAPFSCDCKSCEEPLRQMESTSNQRTIINTSATYLHADNNSSAVDVHLVSDEENPPTAQPSIEHLFTPESGTILSHIGFLGSLPKEELSGTCANLGGQSAGCLLCNRKELSSARQNCSGCANRSGEPQRSTAPGPRNAEKRMAEMRIVESKACSPNDQHMNKLCSVAEACCTTSESVCLDYNVLKLRTETNAEQVDGLKMCHAHTGICIQVSTGTAGLPQEHNGIEAQDSSSYKNNWNNLDGAEISSGSLCSMCASSTSLSGAEALEANADVEGQRMEDDSCMNAEEMLNIDTHVGPPGTNLEQKLIATSSVAGPGGMETVENEKVEEDGQRNGVNELLRGDRCVDKIMHPLELGRLVKDQGKEEPRRFHDSPSSFASDLFSLKTGLRAAPPDLAQKQGCSLHMEDLCAEDPGQLRVTLCQEDSQDLVHFHDPLNSPVSWNQESETTEREVLEGQQYLSIISNQQETGCAVQAVTCSDKETQKSAYCSQNEFLCLKSNGNVTPPVLVIQNDVQQTFQQNMKDNCFSNKTESELVSDPLKGEPVDLNNTEPSSECLECASEWQKLNGSVKEWSYEVKMGEFCSASQSVKTTPSDMQDKNRFLKFSSKSASPSNQSYFHPAPNPLAIANDQNSTEGVSSTLCQNKELSSLIHISLGVQPAQNPGSSLSKKDNPSTSPFPNVLCCPPTQEYPSLTVLLERESNHHVSSLTSGNEKGRCPPQEGSCVDSPHCRERPRSMMGSKADAAIQREIVHTTSSNMDPSRKTKSSLEDHQREGSQTAEKMNLPVCSFSSTVDSSGSFSQDLKRIAGEEEIAVPLKAEACTRLPFDSSELDQSEESPCVIKYPSKTALFTWRSEDSMVRAQQSKDLLPTRSPGILHNTVPWDSPGGSVSEASPKCFRSKGRHWQSTGQSQELAGAKQKSSAHTVNKDIEVWVENMRVSEMGDCPELVAKALQKEARGCPDQSFASRDVLRAKTKVKLNRRILRVRQALGSSLRGVAVKPKVPTQQTFAVGCVIESSKNKSAWSTLRELKRPKMSKDLIELECMEAKNLEVKSSCLSVKNCGWTSTDSNIPLAPVSSKWPQAVGIQSAFGSARKVRQSLPSSRPPGKAWGNVSGPGQFKVARKSNTVRIAFLKNLLEVVPKHKNKLVDSAYSAMQAGAIRKARTVIWSQTPKQRACQSSLLGPSGFSQLTKDQVVLRRLSALANKLLAPPRNPQKLKPPWRSTKFLPLTGQCSQLPSQKLLEVVSCVNMKLNSWWINDSSCCTKMFSSPSLALYPIESTNLCFLDLSNKAPLSFSTPLFPLSFHIKMGPFTTRNLLGITTLQSIPNQVVMGERDSALKPSSWTLSFLFPRSCLGVAPIKEGAWIPAESSATAVSLSAKKDRGEEAITQRTTGCLLRGLQTILALSSPRCYRVWTRKRNLTSHTPAAQKLTVLQFTQGLKGLKCLSAASADLFSSVPYSLGRVLSIWSQHDPSTCPTEFTPLHSNHCKWQPVTTATTSLGLGNSPTMLPQVPDWILEAPRAVADAVRLEPSFSASLPAPCSVSEPALSSLGLSASEFQVHPLDELDVSVPVLPKTGTCLEKADSEKRLKKVSQIRIRKTIPKPDPNLTPMGLPRPKRLKKKEFSLEEIYTNKNYKSPPSTRCLETIFEEPKEKNGSLISVSQQKRKRILEFQDFTVPRKRKVRSRVKVLSSSTRAQKAALEGRELDVLLIQKLTDLETFFAEAEKEQASGS